MGCIVTSKSRGTCCCSHFSSDLGPVLMVSSPCVTVLIRRFAFFIAHGSTRGLSKSSLAIIPPK